MTSIPFAPSTNNSNTPPFTFQPVLDGTTFLATVTWNVYGTRWYFNLYDPRNTPVITCALSGSPVGYPISLLPRLNPLTGNPWISSLYLDDPSQTFVVMP